MKEDKLAKIYEEEFNLNLENQLGDIKEILFVGYVIDNYFIGGIIFYNLLKEGDSFY